VEVEHQQQLLDIARTSIRYGLDNGIALPVQIDDYEPALIEEKASFVTLQINGQLRGCIGSLLAHRPLVVDVAENAFSAAFKDTRFSPLCEEEFEKLHYHISVLSKPVEMNVSSEQDLLSRLEVGVDGVILNEGYHRATFLPTVWEQLPDKREFLHHLKAKAGLAFDYWSDTIEFERYSVESFGT
jgi:AmmeMemoRadiSam system protein A